MSKRWDDLTDEAKDLLCWWIEELEAEGGDVFFIQGKRRLRKPGRYYPTHCCLGVFCEIHPDVVQMSDYQDLRYPGEAQMIGSLTDHLRSDIDLSRQEMSELIDRNDRDPWWSFADIAWQLRQWYSVPEWV